MVDVDEQVLAVRRFVKGKRNERSVQEASVPVEPGELLRGMPVRYRPGGPPFVILKEDTFVELGNPLQGSVSMVLWSRQVHLIRDGLITLIGPDIPEAEGGSLPFGQVILLGGDGLEARDLGRIERASNLAHSLEGYMIRQMPRKLWSRVSLEAGRRGFCFRILGCALMANYRRIFPQLDAVEVLFVTSSKTDVEVLERIAGEARGKSLSVRKLHRKQEGVYECEDLDCESCSDKPTCDRIREVVVIRKRGKVTGIRVVRGTN